MKLRFGIRASRVKGFTLIELMITVVVVAILASIAIPSYNSQIRKSRRTEARNALLDLAGREERFFSTSNSYSEDGKDLGYGDFPAVVGSGYYTIDVKVPAAGRFTLTASSVAGKGQDKDKKCNSFTVTNTGSQASKDSAGGDSTTDCWG